MLTSLLLSFMLSANAVPLQLTQQGRLLDGSGASVTGTHTLTFRIYDGPTGGSVMWSESLTVQFNNGYYATILGSDTQNNALDSGTLMVSYPLYLEVQLDVNNPMSPRQEINSAPYAQVAGVAESVEGGTVSADEIYIGSTLVVDSNGAWQGAALTPSWSNVQGIPSGFSDNVDDVLSSGQVIQYVENQANLNLANSTTVGGNSIVTSSTTLQPNWSNVQGIPSGFSDNVDNELSAGDVENFVEATSTLNLNSSTTIGNAAILTPNSNLDWFNVQNVPVGIADGDELDLLDSNCSAGEIVSWNGSDWACVSDNTLTSSEVGTFLANSAYNLNANTTIGGSTILTDVDNTLVGLGLSCSDGDVAKYDSGVGEWYCDIDIDTNTNTQLSESTVETYITNGSVNLAGGSQVGGSTIVTTSTDSDTLNGLNCSTDEVAKWNGSTWACAADDSGSGTGISYTGMYQNTITAVRPTAQCNDSNDILLYGGCEEAHGGGGSLVSTVPVNATNSSSISGWKCDAGNSSVGAYAVCLTQ